MTITELGLMGVKPNHRVMDESTPEGQLLASIYQNIISLPGGPSQLYLGLEVENPLNIWAFFDWETIEQHEQFAKEFGGEAAKDIPTILSHGEFTKHITLTPSSLVLRSPVTEVLLAYFPSDISDAGKDSRTAEVQHFVKLTLDGCPEVTNVTYGWGVENDFPVRGQVGQVGSVLMVFVGWPSLEASAKFKETKLSKENLGLIRTMEGVIKLVTFYLRCRSLERKRE